MRFYADLHVHSKYSRATSRDLDLEHLAHWAGRKGIGVVATGDFTHPAWRAELKDKLVAAEPGLFRLQDDIERRIAAGLPAACRGAVRFMLSVEISTIYKKGGRTRKIHHLLYAPDFAAADRIAARLARIGNIASDGRPILGLDSRDLLEITLEADPGAYLVPAHIWTPWFAALGSQSGFDSIAECYGDLADHIFAVETGLSSDPPMNWRLSMLDRYRLTSNSDAHSPGKLGREATMFDCPPDYYAMRRALETGEGYVGTVEFFPEEGKYHLDGHRKCGMRLSPRETLAHGGRCPVCGEPATVGVAHRVEVLADRSEVEAVPPPTAGEVTNLVPLSEVLAELLGSGPGSKTVARSYDRLLAALGPELAVLGAVPVDDIARAEGALLAEAITRLRAGAVIREAGYDGAYGVIRLFAEDERRLFSGGGLLFDAPPAKRSKPQSRAAQPVPSRPTPDGPAPRDAPPPPSPAAGGGILHGLDDDQRAAASVTDGPLLIVAGPGSGKTRTITHRIAHLVAACGVPASACLAITFTRRAAAEMRERLDRLLPHGAGQPAIHTFHSLGLALLREQPRAADLQPGLRIAGEAERAALLMEALDLSRRKAATLLRAISRAKRSESPPGDAALAESLDVYARALAARNWIDYDDLVGLAIRALSADEGFAERCRRRFRYLSVDEFQDVDAQQYRLMALIAPPGANLCVIGDPDQAIYGFRGADASCFERFAVDYPGAATVRLARNYRSSGTIVTAASQVIAANGAARPGAETVRAMQERITIHTAASEAAEAEFVVATIEGLIGGHSFFSIDSGRAAGSAGGDLSFADFAVLTRTAAQAAPLGEALTRAGIPFAKHAHEPLAEQPAVRALLEAWESQARDGSLSEQLGSAAARLRGGEVLDPAALDTAWHRLAALAEDCGDDAACFADAVALAAEADFWDPRADRVSLLSLHAAKGLEFPVVFMMGLEDGLMPLIWGARDAAAMAEERRLFYVGMTRAMDRLVLTRARQRHWRGRVRALEPSPFLADIETALTEWQRARGPRRKEEDQQLKLL